MTDPAVPEPAARPPERGPLHPASRVGRVLQQLRSFATLHAAELEGVAAELDAAGQAELAARLRAYRDLHAREAGLILDELADVRAELDREDAPGATTDAVPAEPAAAVPGATEPGAAEPGAVGPGTVNPAAVDPAAGSPKRARWLAEQAREAERRAEEARRPRSRRDLFRRSERPDDALPG